MRAVLWRTFGKCKTYNQPAPVSGQLHVSTKLRNPHSEVTTVGTTSRIKVITTTYVDESLRIFNCPYSCKRPLKKLLYSLC